jgi:hypothetical protein
MPSLTLTVTTGVATRIQAAYGAESLADLKSKIIDDIRNRTIGYETTVVQNSEQVKIQAAHDAQEALIASTYTAASTEIQLT